jgi:hypothetical protein
MASPLGDAGRTAAAAGVDALAAPGPPPAAAAPPALALGAAAPALFQPPDIVPEFTRGAVAALVNVVITFPLQKVVARQA